MNTLNQKTLVLLDGFLTNSNLEQMIIQELTYLLQDQGITLQQFILREMDIAPCDGCFYCWIKTPGLCHQTRDPINTLNKAIIQSDYYMLLTPITFGGYSSEIKKAQDRNISLVLPYFMKYHGETHHQKRYDKYPVFGVIGVLPAPDPGQERIFKELVKRNSLNLFWEHEPVYTIIYETDDPNTIKNKLAQVFQRKEVIYA